MQQHLQIGFRNMETSLGHTGPNHAHEHIHVALRDAFDAAAVRQVEDHVRRMRGDFKDARL
jgi:3-dehydroquinate dehydratase